MEFQKMLFVVILHESHSCSHIELHAMALIAALKYYLTTAKTYQIP
jgi:hypothetical protein